MNAERTLLLLSACLASMAYVHGSCMTRAIASAGVAHWKAAKYARHLARNGMTWNDIMVTEDSLLSAVMRGSLHHAKAIQKCLRTAGSACTTYRWCQNDGNCSPRIREQTFYCKCKISYKGQRCQHARSEESILEKIQAKVSSNQKELAAIESLFNNQDWFIRVLKARVRFLKVNMDAIVKSNVAQALRCTQQGLGYRFESNFAAKDVIASTSVPVATLVFRARGAGNNLRLSYTGRIHTSGRNTTTRLFFTVDGAECVAPAQIDLSVHQVHAGLSQTPVIFQGVCHSIRKGASGFKRGNHTIAVHAVMSSNADASPVGFVTTPLLEVREMCPGPVDDGFPPSAV